MWVSWAQGPCLALSHKQVAQGPCTKYSVWWSNEWTSRITWGPSFSSTELFWNRLSMKIFHISVECFYFYCHIWELLKLEDFQHQRRAPHFSLYVRPVYLFGRFYPCSDDTLLLCSHQLCKPDLAQRSRKKACAIQTATNQERLKFWGSHCSKRLNFLSWKTWTFS